MNLKIMKIITTNLLIFFLMGILIFILTCDYSVDESSVYPSKSYHYKSYNSEGEKVVEGWFVFDEDSTDYISGEWHFDLVGNPDDIGPQVGEGELFGGYENDTTLWIELNPEYRDNNLQLVGKIEGNTYSGKWYWISYPGVTGQGTFIANYKE